MKKRESTDEDESSDQRKSDDNSRWWDTASFVFDMIDMIRDVGRLIGALVALVVQAVKD